MSIKNLNVSHVQHIKTGLFLAFILSMATVLQAQTPSPLTLDKLISQIKVPTTSSTQEKHTSAQDDDSKQKDGSTISDIRFEGLKTLSKDAVLAVLISRPGDAVNPIKVERDEKNIQNLGWFKSAKITQSKDKKGNTVLTIQVDEYPTIGAIEFKGAHIYSAEALKNTIHTKENTLYNINIARKDIQKIEEKYKKDGYSLIKVYRIKSPEKDGDPLEYYVAEGIVDSIIITGNKKTKDYVIVREFDLHPGQVFKDDVFREDIRRIFNLGHFIDVNPNVRPSDTTANAYDVQVDLKEKETSGSFSIGGGYSPNQGFSIMSDLFWDNIMGTGQMILLKGNFALGGNSGNNKLGQNNNYQFKYHNPWMWDKRKSFTFRTWLTQGNFNIFDPSVSDLRLREETRQGFDMAVGIPINYKLEHSHRAKYESISLPIDSYNIYSYTFGLNYDTRDYKENPRDGAFHSFTIEQAMKFRIRALEFTQVDITLRKFIPTFKKQTIALKGQLGYIRSPEIDNIEKFRSQYYSIGGSYSVRGYHDLDPFAYGTAQAIGSIEYRYIFTPAFTGYLFVDGGNASVYESNMFRPSLYRIGKGVGIKFLVPGLGPLRLDFGIDDQGTSRIHFNIGHAF